MNVEKWKGVLTWERVICRLFASWCTFAAILAFRDFGFWEIGYGQELGLGLVIGGILLLFAVYTVIAVLLPAYSTDSWFLMLAATVAACRWIMTYDADADRQLLFSLAVFAVYALFAIYFIRQNQTLLQRWQPGNRTLIVLATLCSLAACVVLSVIGCLRYLTFSTPNFDFGLFVNMFHNMKETGLPLVTSERNELLSHFAVHISPIYYLLLPFYWLFPSPLTLQIGQAVALALGVIPAVLLAKHFGLSGKACTLVAVIYAFFPVLTTGCFYDLHENCFLPLFLLLTFYFFEKKKYPLMYLSALCVLAVKEDAAIYLLIFAVYVLLSRREYLHGGILAAASVGYFLLATHLIETVGDGVLSNRFDNLIVDEESGLFGIVKLALVNPGYLLTQLFTTKDGGWEKISYFLQLLLPVAGLPFCTKKASRWLLITPILINLLSYYPYLYHTGFQYHFATVAFLIYAMIQNLPELKAPARQNLLALGAAACCCIYLGVVMPKLAMYRDRWEDNRETYEQMEEILDALPEDASLNVSTFLLAHVADRDEVYEIGYHKNAPDVDFVVLDLRYGGDENCERAYLRQGYTVYAEHPGMLLILQKGE